MGIKPNPYLQVPHINENNLKTFSKVKGNSSSLKDFLQQDFTKKKGCNLTDEQLNDIEKYSKHVPCIELKANVFVDGEPEIVSGDTLTLEIEVHRINLNEGEVAGPVY